MPPNRQTAVFLLEQYEAPPRVAMAAAAFRSVVGDSASLSPLFWLSLPKLAARKTESYEGTRAAARGAASASEGELDGRKTPGKIGTGTGEEGLGLGAGRRERYATRRGR